MMKKLPSEAYPRVLPLLKSTEIRSHLSLAFALMEERQAGQIFVDDDRNPQTVLLCPDSGFWFLFGAPQSGCFARFLPELLAGHLVDKCAVFATSAGWRHTLNRLFTRTITRAGFEYCPSRAVPDPNWRLRIPAGFSLEPMTEERIRKWHPGIDHWVIDIWGGAARFAAEAFGFCLLSEGRIVSIAAACAIGGGEAEIEVGTVPEFQGRGLSTLACRAFLEECVARDLHPAWSCSIGNSPSGAVARKLGFVEQEQIFGYPLDRTLTEDNGVWRLP
jgi:RimJ/RimL family protein N-acetyltransferase